ncbi:hypothetical protein THIARS_60428 [Thiomonas delicata]|uniref:Uncharacterized protein n=1 Tax=Thiomonas delicata TaxID=364030 RepID=A0A238D399_THIDL|nr:hypothetical protein THIARS_60428 [Thiomonas delicata]
MRQPRWMADIQQRGLHQTQNRPGTIRYGLYPDFSSVVFAAHP